MRQLGLASKPKPAAAAAADGDKKKSVAAAALAAAKAAASVAGASRMDTVTVTEQRRFAGQTITVRLGGMHVAAETRAPWAGKGGQGAAEGARMRRPAMRQLAKPCCPSIPPCTPGEQGGGQGQQGGAEGGGGGRGGGGSQEAGRAGCRAGLVAAGQEGGWAGTGRTCALSCCLPL